MNDKIEGVPDGWRLVRIGKPNRGEWTINNIGEPSLIDHDIALSKNYVIIEKIEQPRQYRPFSNAAEFEPHRDRWFKPNFASCQCIRTTAYNDRGHWVGEGHDTWEMMFEKYLFDDGSPFGVECEE